MIIKSIKPKGKRKVSHGNPLPSRGVTPRSQDRWARVDGGVSKRWICWTCGLRLNDFQECEEHSASGCVTLVGKVGGV